MNVISKRKIITENCTKTHGSFEAALDIALEEVRKAALYSHEGWGDRANIHIVAEVERIT